MASLPKFVFPVILITAFLGFVDAAYLTANHYSGIVPPCFIAQGCDVVTTSVYSKFAGIPVALLGSLYYLTVLVLSLLYLDKKKEFALRVLPIFTTFGFLASIWFVFAQLVLIEALCTYCLFSALTSTILFVMGIIIWRRKPLNSLGSAPL